MECRIEPVPLFMTCLVLYWVKVRNHNLGLTELMYITEHVNPEM